MESGYVEDDSNAIQDVDLELFKGVASPASETSHKAVPMPVAGAFGVVVKNLLSPEESLVLCGIGEKLGMTPASRKPAYRNCDRAVFRCEPLATLLWQRLSHIVPSRVDDAPSLHVHESALGLEGVWHSTRLNSVFRIVKYQQGGHFSPHYDGDVCMGPALRSFLTVNIYLNGDFEGGHTEFLSKSVELGTQVDSDGPLLSTAVVSHVAPATGSAVVFSHHVLHQGAALGPGAPKWILRTDVMYEQESGTAHKYTEKQQRALALLQEACQDEAVGRGDDACRKYRAAFKLWPDLEKTV